MLGHLFGTAAKMLLGMPASHSGVQRFEPFLCSPWQPQIRVYPGKFPIIAQVLRSLPPKQETMASFKFLAVVDFARSEPAIGRSYVCLLNIKIKVAL